MIAETGCPSEERFEDETTEDRRVIVTKPTIKKPSTNNKDRRRTCLCAPASRTVDGWSVIQCSDFVSRLVMREGVGRKSFGEEVIRRLSELVVLSTLAHHVRLIAVFAFRLHNVADNVFEEIEYRR